MRAEIEQRRERLAREVGAEEAEILDALVLVLDDDALLAPARQAIDASRSAGRAWADAVAAIADRYRALDDPYQRERADDVVDVGNRVLRALAADRGTPPADRGPNAADRGADAADRGADAAGGGERHILVARDLTPIDAAGLDRALVLGIATAAGGPTSHGAILARALGVPAVLGLGQAVLDAAGREAQETHAILDGDAGILVPRPGPDTVRDYRERKARAAALAEQARAAAHDPGPHARRRHGRGRRQRRLGRGRARGARAGRRRHRPLPHRVRLPRPRPRAHARRSSTRSTPRRRRRSTAARS